MALVGKSDLRFAGWLFLANAAICGAYLVFASRNWWDRGDDGPPGSHLGNAFIWYPCMLVTRTLLLLLNAVMLGVRGGTRRPASVVAFLWLGALATGAWLLWAWTDAFDSVRHAV